MQKLSLFTSYVWSGNTLSRSFFLRDSFASEKLLFVFAHQEAWDQDREVLGWTLGRPVTFLDGVGMFAAAEKESSGYFAVTIDFFSMAGSLDRALSEHRMTLRVGQTIAENDLVERLLAFGYAFSPYRDVERTYHREGDSLRICISSEESVILSLFDDTIDSIVHVIGGDLSNQKVIDIHSFQSTSWSGDVTPKKMLNKTLFSHLTSFTVVLLDLDFFPLREALIAELPRWVEFANAFSPSSVSLGVTNPRIESLDDLRCLLSSRAVIFVTRRPQTIEGFLSSEESSFDRSRKSKFSILEAHIHGLESFETQDQVVIADDVLSRIFIQSRSKKSLAKNLDLLLHIRSGDYVVHRDHGVGVFRGIILKKIGEIEREYAQIDYADSDRLFVPIVELDRMSKYVGESDPRLTRLSSTEWSKVIAKTEQEIAEVASDLLELYAKRSLAKGFAFRPFPKEEKTFRDAFPYVYTFDQNQAILEIAADMEQDIPMERLLSGDVGFGKTEVAMNAVYRAFLNKKQSVLLSPLVVLAHEHYDSLIRRFAGFGVRIGLLTRVSTPAEERAVLRGLADGSIDVVVGTHRLLSEDVRFHNLGLLVVDEEHKFGVLDKERIHRIKTNIDLLSLSATPIPRSLHFALSGLKKVSFLTTPPQGRKPILTTFVESSEATIFRAVYREILRGGQVIFLHNRVRSLDEFEQKLRTLFSSRGEIAQEVLGDEKVPLPRIITTHGKMNGIDLEMRILDFKERKFDILLTTTIIENGVNFLDANTIIVDRSDTFGLAQLHQLRGRVGRRDKEAYCYLLYDGANLTDEAKERLVTIVNASHLGAGFEIALRDLEMRGAGEVLGVRQSGRTKETGIPLYLKMLEEKIEELRSSKPRSLPVKIDLSIAYHIPDSFFESELDKLSFFRTIESIETEEDLGAVESSFALNREDPAYEMISHFFLLLRVRIRCAGFRIAQVRKVIDHYVIDLDPSATMEELKHLLERDKKRRFVLANPHKIRIPCRYFQGELDFLRKLGEDLN